MIERLGRPPFHSFASTMAGAFEVGSSSSMVPLYDVSSAASPTKNHERFNWAKATIGAAA
jgi:hypothetical protein